MNTINNINNKEWSSRKIERGKDCE